MATAARGCRCEVSRSGVCHHVMNAAAQLDRSIVENIVRQIVLVRGDGAAPQKTQAPTGGEYTPNVVVSISARHCHLTDEHVEILFGPGSKLIPEKPLY